jgi:hypothetical protein
MSLTNNTTSQAPIASNVTPNTSDNLLSSSVKTGVQKSTIIVLDPVSGQILHQIIIRNVSDWYKNGRVLIINEVNNTIPIELTFISKAEIESAEERFIKIFNGEVL